MGCDLVGVTLATLAGSNKPGRRNVPNHLALTAGLSIMRRTWLSQQVTSRRAEECFRHIPCSIGDEVRPGGAIQVGTRGAAKIAVRRLMRLPARAGSGSCRESDKLSCHVGTPASP